MRDDLTHLRHAARLAWRGQGSVEPNPMVGCVILDRTGCVAGAGHHRRIGEAHAEIEALRRAGEAARGGTAYVTLEPCTHHGRTGPCTEALVAAGVRRVVIARLDPTPEAGGGAARLRAAGLEVEIVGGCAEAIAVGAPFAHRAETGRPWVTAKWAQTLDGRVATRSGESQWISGPASRRAVHRQRGRVDAIMTGIGTVLADDPLLTARDVPRRRAARRVVVDPLLQVPLGARLATTAGEHPTTIACTDAALRERAEHAGRLAALGAEVLGLPVDPASGDLDLAALLETLTATHDVTTLLVEAGPGLLGRLLRHRLVDLAWVFIAPMIMGDDEAIASARGLTTPHLAGAIRLAPLRTRRLGDDLELVARVKGGGGRAEGTAGPRE